MTATRRKVVNKKYKFSPRFNPLDFQCLSYEIRPGSGNVSTGATETDRRENKWQEKTKINKYL